MKESKVLKEIKCVKRIVHFLYRPGPENARPTGLVPELQKSVDNHLTGHKVLNKRLFLVFLTILTGLMAVLVKVW